MAVAYCWATGMIEIGEATPDGAIPLAVGDATVLHESVRGEATLAYDNATMLIPGFNLALDDDAKLDCVAAFADRLHKCLR